MQQLMPPIDSPDNLFHNGNPLTGEKGTIVTAEFLNNSQSAVRDVQTELLAILAQAATDAKPDVQNQLLTALKKLFLSRANPFSDIASDGAIAITQALTNLGLVDSNGYVGRKTGEQWITSSKMLTLNPLTTHFKAIITGAGAGGGGAFNGGGSSDNFSGGGGAAGGTGIKWFKVSDVTDWAIVIGSGGTEATKGGDSSFSGIVAPGGAPAVASTVFAAGGTGVAGTGADINLPGGDGGDGQNGAYLLSGFGGASYWGGSRRAGQGQSGSIAIPKAKVPGAGGGGAFDTQKMGVRFYGGQGADGICFIEEYA
ncbi:hypothetical protein BTJ39_14345 [Izhakiella australiensis]|uniref:Glycine-rich domain-containing protein n=1 Tax=Izhakiella australiensis TaxID=1926881 RepID=A0A1S8YK46_9GAMM|nr:hypothetical protein [Izhakiella australiensis]OON39451.1 hypothetical protein BTJ39_14345 [Izhakiella australiensis]